MKTWEGDLYLITYYQANEDQYEALRFGLGYFKFLLSNLLRLARDQILRKSEKQMLIISSNSNIQSYGSNVVMIMHFAFISHAGAC